MHAAGHSRASYYARCTASAACGHSGLFTRSAKQRDFYREARREKLSRLFEQKMNSTIKFRDATRPRISKRARREEFPVKETSPP